MPLTSADVTTAGALQIAAAHDANDAVRLVAGPGTGKSASVEERFRWLLDDRGIDSRAVYGVSFTRASANDLRLRVAKYLDESGLFVGRGDLRISTLHSLALQLLVRANLLGSFPVRPRVMDDWEVENVFDAEFRATTGWPKGRCEDIRKGHEAFWNTGQSTPAGYIAPDPPISNIENDKFLAFHSLTTQSYAAVLPGEIVRLCVERIDAGHLVVSDVADMAYLIIDEYQDLNPLDLKFVDRLHDDGVAIFAAGDDDQSIYSFRFAAPGGIQDFIGRHPGAGDHILEGCFRCAADIVDGADDLIRHFSPTTRIPKTLDSLWRTASPPESGQVLRWKVPNGQTESQLVAQSARQLVGEGLPPRNIMVLVSHRGLLPGLRQALADEGIPFTSPRDEAWRDTDGGRFVLGVVRIVLDQEDYLALRLVLGCRQNVGALTCAGIVLRAESSYLNYRDLFYEDLPAGVFTTRQSNALAQARGVCSAIANLKADTKLEECSDLLERLLTEAGHADDLPTWHDAVEALPPSTTLAELRDYLSAENPEQQENVLMSIYERIEAPPPQGVPGQRLRILTMHGAKGLQADVVFIPGLEEPVLPGPRRAVNQGQVLEGARLLYVSMTRARACLVLSFARSRYWQGNPTTPAPSRYTTFVGGPFVERSTALTADQAAAIASLAERMGET